MKPLALTIVLLALAGCATTQSTPETGTNSDSSTRSQLAATRKPNQASRNAEALNSNWWVGGTLHSSDLAGWNRAPYQDRLATAADLMVVMMRNDGGKQVSSMAELKPLAQQLEANISEVAKEPGALAQPVNQIAAALYLLEQASY